MKFVIIEDEAFIAHNFAEAIKKIRPSYEQVALLSSVENAVDFFRKNKSCQLVFSDIALGDGISFEIFDKVEVHSPLIFCTAYEKYAVEAFEANGIDFILKPFTDDRVEKAILKFENLAFQFISQQENLQKISSHFIKNTETARAKTFLVHYKDQIIPFKKEDIRMFYIREELVHLVDFNWNSYVINEPLDEIEKEVKENFFRVNRQCLLHRTAIKNVVRHTNRKLTVHPVFEFPEEITVSKEKASAFLSWLTEK